MFDPGGGNPVVDRLAVAAKLNDPALAQAGKLLGDCRLAHLQFVGKLGHCPFARDQLFDQRETVLIGQGAQEQGRAFNVDLTKGGALIRYAGFALNFEEVLIVP